MEYEIKEDTTTEEIEAAVESANAEIASENGNEAINVSEENKVDKVDETNEAEGKTEEDNSGDWLNDELKAEVAAYGIDEDELADFTSREELDRALRLFDKSALEAGRKAQEEGSEQEGKAEETTKPEEKSGYEVDLDPEEFDENLVGELKRMKDYYEGRFAEMESQFSAIAEEQEFDGIVDNLGHADLFGKSGKETKKEVERREEVMIAVKAYRIGLEQLGRPVEMNEALVERVAKMVHHDAFSKKERKAHTRKITKQSNGRMGGNVTKPHEAAESQLEYVTRVHEGLLSEPQQR